MVKTMDTRIVFMGTPDIACAMLQQLLDDHYHVVGVVTQPDKKAGRKQEWKMSEVKQKALACGIEVFQPLSIKEDYDPIIQWEPDLIVTCAYGQFIPQALLKYPRYGSINIHASLLPKLRGGAPIHWAVIQGMKTTGMSIMRMVSKMDAGAVMAQRAVTIEEDDTTGDVYEKLKDCGAQLLHESMEKLINGEAVFIDQEESAATFGYNISKDDEKIDFHRPVDEVYNHIRGLIPFPVGYAVLNNKKIKFHKVRKKTADHHHACGELCGLMDGGYAIAALGGYILLEELRLEGKARIDAKSFANGQGRNWLGSCLK